MMLSLMFKKQNFEVATAENGFEAFNCVKNTIENHLSMFELIVLDLNMPIMNG